jgi:sporulation-control protein spo0M
METAERIYEKIKALPEPLRREVLEFVEHLALKLREEDAEWSALSLRAALQGLENEPTPEYGEGDFKEKWK